MAFPEVQRLDGGGPSVHVVCMPLSWGLAYEASHAEIGTCCSLDSCVGSSEAASFLITRRAAGHRLVGFGWSFALSLRAALDCVPAAARRGAGARARRLPRRHQGACGAVAAAAGMNGRQSRHVAPHGGAHVACTPALPWAALPWAALPWVARASPSTSPSAHPSSAQLSWHVSCWQHVKRSCGRGRCLVMRCCRSHAVNGVVAACPQSNPCPPCIHVHASMHACLQAENCLLTSWSWLLLADWPAGAKPTYLPEDNPVGMHPTAHTQPTDYF